MSNESRDLPGFSTGPSVRVAGRGVVAEDRPRSVGELYRAHAERVARWAARLAGPGLETEDIVQEVFLIAHRQLDGFRGDAQVTSWLFGITNNVVRHRRRKERLRRLLLGAAEREPHPLPSRPTPVEVLERREASATVYRALDGMAEKYRTVFVLFEIEGLSGQEIVALTGLNASTVRVHLMRARAQFLERLARIAAEGARGKGGGV